MEIRARVFFSLWAITGFLFLYLGIGALERTDLPNSIPPPIFYLFKISLFISTCHSATYALVFRPKLVRNYYVSVLWVMSPSLINFISACISFDWYVISGQLLIYPLFYYLLYWKNFPHVVDDHQLVLDSVTNTILILVFCFLHGEWFGSFAILILNLSMMLNIPTTTTHVPYMFIFMVGTLSKSPPQIRNSIYLLDLVMIPFVYFTCTAWGAIELLAGGENRIVANLKRKQGRVIEFAMGMAGTIVFQNYFRLTTFHDVVAFLYLAVAWLANLAMLLCAYDFGIFNFILGNVIVGCTVSEFGLTATTWLVYGTCLLLYMLRLKLETLSVVDRGPGQEAVIVWDARRE